MQSQDLDPLGRFDLFDLGKLRSAVRADDPAIVCHAVMHHLIGNRAPTDDIAVLAMRRTASRTGM